MSASNPPTNPESVAPPSKVVEGLVLGEKYRVMGKIGSGGMASVYLGEHLEIKRKVAIKMMNGATRGDAIAFRRFRQEAQVVASIRSDRITQVLDFGQTPDGDPYLVMEYLEGRTLAEELKAHGPLAPGRMVAIALQILEGMEAAHDAGVVHRDLKPGNVFLVQEAKGRRESAKIIDFGIAKAENTEELNLTATGMVMGSPQYMAPEQIDGAEDLDGRTDVYAVGVLLYRCISGRHAFRAATFSDVVVKIALGKFEPLDQLVPGIDPGLARVVHQAMHRDRGERFPDCSSFAEALVPYAASPAAGTGAYSAIVTPPPLEATRAEPTPAQGNEPHTHTRNLSRSWEVGERLNSGSRALAAGQGKKRRGGLIVGAVAVALLSAGALAVVLRQPTGMRATSLSGTGKEGTKVKRGKKKRSVESESDGAEKKNTSPVKRSGKGGSKALNVDRLPPDTRRPPAALGGHSSRLPLPKPPTGIEPPTLSTSAVAKIIKSPPAISAPPMPLPPPAKPPAPAGSSTDFGYLGPRLPAGLRALAPRPTAGDTPQNSRACTHPCA